MMLPQIALRIIQQRLAAAGGEAQIPLMNGIDTFRAVLVDGGIEVDNLGQSPFLPWRVFTTTIELLNEQHGHVRKGNAMNNRLGEPGLPFNSVEGAIATTVYNYSAGDTVFRRITPVAAILSWTGICINGVGVLSYVGYPLNEAIPILPVRHNADNQAPDDGDKTTNVETAFHEPFLNILVKFFERRLANLDLNSPYWKGMSWQETIDYRRSGKISSQSSPEALSRVLQWGGIYKFSNWELYRNGLQILDKGGVLDERMYSRLSSLSKLFSFTNPDKYFILDTRVTFTLNAIIATQHQEQGGIDMPFLTLSRNTHLKSAAPLVMLNKYFPNLGVAYQAYNDLILKATEQIRSNGSVHLEYPELLEMILFDSAEDFFTLDYPEEQDSARPVISNTQEIVTIHTEQPTVQGGAVTDENVTPIQRPPANLLNYYQCNYREDDVFASAARLLQSVYSRENSFPLAARSRNGQTGESYGNLIDVAYGMDTMCNFLTDNIKNLVNTTLLQHERVKSNRSLISKDRLFGNLLSSQPLAFNLFGELAGNLPLASILFNQLIPTLNAEITSIEFEYSPGRGDATYTADRTAFDVFLKYKRGETSGFIGVEVKYAESLNDKPAAYRSRYAEVATRSEVFSPDNVLYFSTMPQTLEQIWRDHLLCLSMLPSVNTDYQEGCYLFAYPAGNANCANAIKTYNSRVLPLGGHNKKCLPVTLERIINTLRMHTQASWVKDFYKRYLDFGRLKTLNSAPHII